MKKILLGILAISMLSISAQAQRHHEKKTEFKQAAQELHKEMRAWFESSVYPTLKQWHDEYDASLSSEDLSTLNQLRTQAKQLKESAHADMKGQFKDSKRDKDAMREKMHEMKAKYKDQMRSLMEKLKPIAKNSRATLLGIHDRGEGQIEKWKSEAKTIIDRWKAKSDVDDTKRGGRGSHGMHGIEHDFLPFAADGKRAAVRFMLWDGNMPQPKQDAPFGDSDPFDTNLQNGPQVFPNPTLTTARIEMKDVANGPAKIELFSMSGTLLKSTTTNITGNTVSEVIDISSLPAGNYMVSVNTAAGRKTTQLVIDK
ncbi:MAG: T9SS type A sorting domain-containing protein [Ignavibacteria bacterium]|nr:T9SS type A sorting domain-containing protein [Ignavibacteria bacterium]